MATIAPIVSTIRRRIALEADLLRLLCIGVEMPRRRAKRLAAEIVTGNRDGLRAFFLDVLGWTREPTPDELDAAIEVLTSGRKWRKTTKVGAPKVVAYIARGIARRMFFDARNRRGADRLRRTLGSPRGKPTRTDLLRKRVIVLRACEHLPADQRAVLDLLAEGTTPADALRITGSTWATYSNLMHRARRLEADRRTVARPRLVKRA